MLTHHLQEQMSPHLYHVDVRHAMGSVDNGCSILVVQDALQFIFASDAVSVSSERDPVGARPCIEMVFVGVATY